MTRLRSWALGGVILGLLATAAPAHANNDSRYVGGCVLLAATDENGVVTAPHDFTGVLVGAVVVYSVDTPSDNTVDATLRCYVKVNGSEVVWTPTASGTAVVVAGPTLVSFHADDTDTVEVCTTVDYTNNTTPTVNTCTDVTRTHVPPQEVLDLASAVIQVVMDLKRQILDPILCPIFATLSPGIPGIVDINPEGDVFLLGSKIWDCPPYDIDPPPIVNLQPVEVMIGTDLNLEPI